MDTQRLSLGLLIAAICLIVLSLATDKWGCGNLITDCPKYTDTKTGVIAALAFIFLGLILVFVVLILDIIACCVTSLHDRAALAHARMIILFIGCACIIVGILVFTGVRLYGFWSYLSAVVGSVLALQVAIIAALTSSCVCVSSTTTHRQVVTHHRVAT